MSEYAIDTGGQDTITEEAIRSKVTEKSFERGEGYYDHGMVNYVVRRGDRLFARVQGSDWNLIYDTGVFLNGDDFTASCACPYDWGGYCKHIVAVALTYLRDSDTLEVRPPLEETLSGMDAGELRALALRMVERDPRMANVIDGLDHLDEEPDCDCDDFWWE